MKTREQFAKKLADVNLDHKDRAVAFLWYYARSQEYEERTAAELANDLHDEGFPKPQATRLHKALTRSRFTIRGKRSGTFQLDVRQQRELDERFGKLLGVQHVQVSDSVLPSDWVFGTRGYLERMVHQINGAYQFQFYDACGVLCRRLMESLIIEAYIHEARREEIKCNDVFLQLDALIAHITSDSQIALSRGTPKTMRDTKQLGDTAAHHRLYITNQLDIDDLKSRYRRMIRELLLLAGIMT